MSGALASIYRHPVKGFTPERLAETFLSIGRGVAFDRAYAVENGPSGFDPQAPAHIAKIRFTVLAALPQVALVRTRFEDATHTLHAEAPGLAPIAARLSDEAGRDAFAAWLTTYLGDDANGPLRVFEGPGAHRFYDNPDGKLSLINLASLRDIAKRLGRPVDPLRFRANLYVEGWPAWSELELQNQNVRIGAVRFSVLSPIRRCIATHVDLVTGTRDIDMLETLRSQYGHLFCGIYLQVTEAGAIRDGDRAEAA